MTQPEIYELLEQVLRPVEQRLDADGRTELDGLIDVASRKLATPTVGVEPCPSS